MPPKMLIKKYFIKIKLPETFCVNRPIMNALIGNPIKNPPVGPNNICTPVFPPGKTGTPIIIKIKNNICEYAPNLAPIILPAIIGPIDCAVIGTPITGICIGGNIPKIITIEQNNEIYTNSLIFIF